MSDSGTSAGSRVLVVEDEPAIADVITTALRFAGHAVSSCDDGVAGLAEAQRAAFDLLVLDVNLPGIDGFAICQRLRKRGSDVPVLFLTARDAQDDRLAGLRMGADDYLTKPFSVEELVLRVGAILRRTGVSPADLLVYDDLTIDPASHEVRRSGQVIDLSATEYRLLHYLMINATVVLSKAQILIHVWDEDYEGSENIVELYIGYLRRKLEANHPRLIHTKRGLGYVLRAPDS